MRSSVVGSIAPGGSVGSIVGWFVGGSISVGGISIEVEVAAVEG